MGKSTLFATAVVVSGIVFVVHYQQIYDKTEMHKGVLKDMARLEAKKQSRQQHQDIRVDDNNSKK